LLNARRGNVPGVFVSEDTRQKSALLAIGVPN
jgi:hypothetical protein